MGLGRGQGKTLNNQQKFGATRSRFQIIRAKNVAIFSAGLRDPRIVAFQHETVAELNPKVGRQPVTLI